jgi:hypothetical protein
MNLVLVPQTRLGRRAVALAGVAVVLGIAATVIASIQGNALEYPNPFNSPVLGTAIYLTFVVAAAAAITGIMAVRRQGERSLTVFAVVGLFGAMTINSVIMLLAGIFGALRR